MCKPFNVLVMVMSFTGGKINKMIRQKKGTGVGHFCSNKTSDINELVIKKYLGLNFLPNEII